MKTFPAGCNLFFGIFHEGIAGCLGVAVFGKSSSTDSKLKLFPVGMKPANIIEMQRLWISDAMGKNEESKTLSLIIEKIKVHAPEIKVLWSFKTACTDS
jgi:hypothetical protein